MAHSLRTVRQRQKRSLSDGVAATATWSATTARLHLHLHVHGHWFCLWPYQHDQFLPYALKRSSSEMLSVWQGRSQHKHPRHLTSSRVKLAAPKSASHSPKGFTATLTAIIASRPAKITSTSSVLAMQTANIRPTVYQEIKILQNHSQWGSSRRMTLDGTMASSISTIL